MLIMPFVLDDPGRYCADYITEKVGNVSGHDYQKFEKGRDSEIVYMTCDEYIERCIKDIFDSDYKSTVDNAVEEYKVQKYAEAMENGDIFPMCYLDYDYRQQEGRHRMFAFKEVNGPDAEAPILIIFPTDTDNLTDEEIREYCEKKWKTDIDYWMTYIKIKLGMIDKMPEAEEDEEDEEELEPLIDAAEEISDYNDITEDDIDEIIFKLSEVSGIPFEKIYDDPLLFSRLLSKYDV